MKRVLIPTVCIAALSTVAFEEKGLATQSDTVVSENTFKTSTKYVNISDGLLNVRVSASTSAIVVSTLIKGTEVTEYLEENGWSKVKVNGIEGYVKSNYLSPNKLESSISSTSSIDMTTKYVNVNSGSLNMRKSATTSAAIITSIKKGTAVTVYSEANGWSKIKIDGKEGYVSSNYLTSITPGTNISTTTPVPETTTKYVNVNSGSLNMRKSATTSAAIITSIKKGTSVTVYSEGDGWSKVKVDGKEGYVSSKYLTSTKLDTPSSTTPEQKATTKYVNVSSGSLNMRTNASTNASIIVKLKRGKEVKVYTESNGWAKIEVFGQTGYVSSQYLSTTNPSNSDSSTSQNISMMYVNVNTGSSLNFRKSASSSATVLSKLTKGTKVTVYSESNGWAKVTVNGQEGYVSADYLTSNQQDSDKTEVKEETVETKYVNVSSGSSLNMRNKASTNSSIIVKLARGVEITVLSEINGWAKIKAYGHFGYVSSQYLSTTKPSVGSVSVSTDNSPDSNENSEDNTISKYVNVMIGSTLNMRSKASTSASIINKLSRGTVVKVNSEENEWERITANDQTGYVSSRYLSVTEPDNPNTSNDGDKNYENLSISLDELTEIQMAVNPQTDKKYNTYIREDALTLNSPASGTVKEAGWNVRGGAGANHWVVGTVSKGETLQIISKVMGTDGYYWYQVNYGKSWVNASPDDVKYYLDPNNFRSSIDSLQFLKLSVSANLNAAEVNEKILARKGILQGLASAFITAGEMYSINEIYLISHALLETGNGTSQLAKGVQVNGKTVYNMYGIGAYDGSAITSGSQYAYNAGWFTPEAAIIGGAKFIAQGYISAGQDTLYKMRWNPAAAIINGYAAHQYATDIGWAVKQVNQIYYLYSLLDSYNLVLDIPDYKI